MSLPSWVVQHIAGVKHVLVNQIPEGDTAQLLLQELGKVGGLA